MLHKFELKNESEFAKFELEVQKDVKIFEIQINCDDNSMKVNKFKMFNGLVGLI